MNRAFSDVANFMALTLLLFHAHNSQSSEYYYYPRWLSLLCLSSIRNYIGVHSVLMAFSCMESYSISFSAFRLFSSSHPQSHLPHATPPPTLVPHAAPPPSLMSHATLPPTLTYPSFLSSTYFHIPYSSLNLCLEPAFSHVTVFRATLCVCRNISSIVYRHIFIYICISSSIYMCIMYICSYLQVYIIFMDI